MLAKQWLNNTRGIMDQIENEQMENIRRAAEVMANSIEAGRWVPLRASDFDSATAIRTSLRSHSRSGQPHAHCGKRCEPRDRDGRRQEGFGGCITFPLSEIA